MTKWRPLHRSRREQYPGGRAVDDDQRALEVARRVISDADLQLELIQETHKDPTVPPDEATLRQAENLSGRKAAATEIADEIIGKRDFPGPQQQAS